VVSAEDVRQLVGDLQKPHLRGDVAQAIEPDDGVVLKQRRLPHGHVSPGHLTAPVALGGEAKDKVIPVPTHLPA